MFQLYYVVPESPRWLIAKGDLISAERIIQKGAKVNRRTIPQNILENVFSKSDKNLAARKVPKKSKIFFELFRRKKLLLRTLNLFLQWFSVTFVYYGLSFGSTSLSGKDEQKLQIFLLRTFNVFSDHILEFRKFCVILQQKLLDIKSNLSV